MKQMQRGFLLAFLVAATLATGAKAAEITIWDKNSNSTPGTWGYDPGSTPREDQEVEPGNSGRQKWDLEAFLLDGSMLTLVGGYDFANGVDDGTGHIVTSGDLFFNTVGTLSYGTDINGTGDGTSTILNSFVYEYALRPDFTDLANPTYDLYALTSSSQLKDSYYSANQESDPWRYSSGGTLVANDVAYIYDTDASEYGYMGTTHYAMTFDISSFIAADTVFTVHYTMECGNDNIMGQGSYPVRRGVADGASTLSLLGLALVALGILRRKFAA